MKNFFVAVVFTVIIVFGNSCCNVHHDVVVNKSEQSDYIFFKSPLDTVVIDYIKKVDGHFYDKYWLYYNVYFYEEDNSKFFTIWAFTCYPDYISDCINTASFAFYLTKVLNRKVIVISENENKFIFPSNRNAVLANLEKEKEYYGDIYDGPFYFETYEIIEEKNGINVVKADFVRSDFVNCDEIEILSD